MASKDDVYIKDGHILRGEEAMEELLVQDMKEVIRDSGLESQIKEQASPHAESDQEDSADGTVEGVASDVEKIIQQAGKQSRIKLKLIELKTEKPAAKFSAQGLKCKAGNVELTGAAASLSPPKINLSAESANVKALNVAGTAVTGKVSAPDVSVSAQGASVKAVSIDSAVVDYNIGADIGVTVNTAALKTMNVSASGEKFGARASAVASAKGIDAKFLNADIMGINTAAEAEAVASVKGADVKVGNASVTGVQKTAKAEAKAAATGLDVNVANVKMVGYKKHRGAGASAEAKGMEFQAATANVAGLVDKSEVTCEARAVGSEVRAANVSITGKKTGKSAKATVKVQGAEVKAASVNVQGEDSSVSAQAELNVGAASARVATVNVTPQGGTHFQAKADLTPGFDAFNVNVGTHKGAGIGVSSRFQVGNVGLSAGPPNLTFGPGLNLSFGGGSSSSGGGSKKQGSSSSGSSSSGGGSGHYTTDGGLREPANINGQNYRGFGQTGGQQRGIGSSGDTQGGGQSASIGIGSDVIMVGNGNTQSSNGFSTERNVMGSGQASEPHSQGRATKRWSSGDSFNQSDKSHYGSAPRDSEGASSMIKNTRLNSDTTMNNDHIPQNKQVDGPYTGSYKGRGNLLLAAGRSGVYRAGEYNLRRRLRQAGTDQQSSTPSHSSTMGRDNSSKDAVRSSTRNSYNGSNGRTSANNTNNMKNSTETAPTNPTLDFSQHHVEDPSLPSGGHVSHSERRGFSSTHRRSEHPVTHSPAPGQYHRDGDSSNGGFINADTISARRAVGKTDKKRAAQKQEVKYGEKLAKVVSEKIRHLKPEKPKQERKSVKKELPSTRDEAKRDLKQRLETFRKDIEKHEAQKSGKTSGASSSHSTGSGKGLGTGSESGTEIAAAESVDSKPKEKPFGATRNIHTLGCFQNESSKHVKKLHGKVYGFDP